MTSYNNYSNRRQQKTSEKSTKFSKTGVDLSKSLNTYHGLEFVEKGYEPPDTLSESLKQKIDDLFADTAITNAELTNNRLTTTTSPLRKKNTFDFGGVYLGPTESNLSSKRKSFQDRRGSASLNDLPDSSSSEQKLSIKAPSNPLAVPQIHLEAADAEDFHFPKEAAGGTPFKRRSKIEYVRGTSAPELKGGSSNSTSICNLFEAIPQREFVEAGYDPCAAAINQSGKEASSKEAFSHGKRPSSNSSSSPIVQQPFLTSKATSSLRLPNSSNFSTTLVIDEFKIKCKSILIRKEDSLAL